MKRSNSDNQVIDKSNSECRWGGIVMTSILASFGTPPSGWSMMSSCDQNKLTPDMPSSESNVKEPHDSLGILGDDSG